MRQEIRQVINDYFIDHDGQWSWSSQPLQLVRQAADSHATIEVALLAWLGETFPEYGTRDLTELKEGQSYGIELLLHKGVKWGIWEVGSETRLIEKLGGSYRSINIFISILMPLYYITCYQVHLRGVSVWNCVDESDSQLISTRIADWLHKRGYQSIPLEEANENVPEATSDIFEKDEITVFKCLFGELYRP